MSHQIIKQPDGLFAIWSTIVDNFVAYNLTKEDIIEYEIEEAKREATERINKIVGILNKGETYGLFMTWSEANDLLQEINQDIK